jgi:hypothetical protein
VNGNEKVVLGLTPNTTHEKPDPTAKLDRNSSRRKSTRSRPRGDDLALVLAADLAGVFGREAPEVSLTALGQAITLEGQRREARP